MRTPTLIPLPIVCYMAHYTYITTLQTHSGMRGAGTHANPSRSFTSAQSNGSNEEIFIDTLFMFTAMDVTSCIDFVVLTVISNTLALRVDLCLFFPFVAGINELINSLDNVGTRKLSMLHSPSTGLSLPVSSSSAIWLPTTKCKEQRVHLFPLLQNVPGRGKWPPGDRRFVEHVVLSDCNEDNTPQILLMQIWLQRRTGSRSKWVRLFTQMNHTLH